MTTNISNLPVVTATTAIAAASSATSQRKDGVARTFMGPDRLGATEALPATTRQAPTLSGDAVTATTATRWELVSADVARDFALEDRKRSRSTGGTEIEPASLSSDEGGAAVSASRTAEDSESSSNGVSRRSLWGRLWSGLKFMAQLVSQEKLGPGLHIEPWKAAINAYEKTAAGPSRGPQVTNIVV
ncbi:hypothetical protein CCP2SC5_980002 [Azospirillaceae bacterium]